MMVSHVDMSKNVMDISTAAERLANNQDASSITASEMKQHFGKYLDAAQRSPVTINKNGRPTAVLISFEDYQKNIAVDNVDLNYWTNEFERLSEEQLTNQSASQEEHLANQSAHDSLFGATPDDMATAYQTGLAKRGY